MRYSILLIIVTSFLYSCFTEGDNLDTDLRFAINTAENSRGLTSFILPDSKSLKSIPQDPKNPLTAEKVALGKMLFHESAFSTIGNFEEFRQTYSCATCHHVDAGFKAGILQSIGDGGIGYGIAGEGRKPAFTIELSKIDAPPLNAPSALNVAYQTNLLWNGQFGATNLNIGTEDLWPEDGPVAMNRLGYEGVETQAIAGIKVHRMEYSQQAIEQNGYKAAFDSAFPGKSPESKYSDQGAGLAIAAYERTLLTHQSPFQLWLRGNNDALTDQQKQGAILFFTKGQCVSCHYGPNLASMEFYALGMNDFDPMQVMNFDKNDPLTLGRASFTKKSEDEYKFKVPQLYNLKNNPFYGHGGSFNTIREIIAYKNNAIPQKSGIKQSQLAEEFVPLQLSEEEIDKLTDFIENALFDSNLDRFVPDRVLSDLCIPNNDYLSKMDLGCN